MDAMFPVLEVEIQGYEYRGPLPWWVTSVFVVALILAVLLLILLLTRKRGK